MAEANPESGTITEEALLDSLFEEPSANPELDGQAAPDAEVVDEPTGEELDGEAAQGEPEAPEGELEAQPSAEAQTFTVKIDGKDVSVTQEELLSGYQRQADYTRKTQEVAQMRGQIDAAAGELKGLLEYWATPKTAEPDWVQAAQTMSPQEYNAARAQWDQQSQRQKQAAALHQRIAQQEQSALLQREQAALLSRVPEWSNPEVARGEMASITKAAADFGFSEADVAGCVDHRLILMARELARMKSAQASLGNKRPATPAPRAPIQGRPAQGDVTAKSKALLDNFKRTGSDDDALRLILGD